MARSRYTQAPTRNNQPPFSPDYSKGAITLNRFTLSSYRWAWRFFGFATLWNINVNFTLFLLVTNILLAGNDWTYHHTLDILVVVEKPRLPMRTS